MGREINSEIPLEILLANIVDQEVFNDEKRNADDRNSAETRGDLNIKPTA